MKNQESNPSLEMDESDQSATCECCFRWSNAHCWIFESLKPVSNTWEETVGRAAYGYRLQDKRNSLWNHHQNKAAFCIDLCGWPIEAFAFTGTSRRAPRSPSLLQMKQIFTSSVLSGEINQSVNPEQLQKMLTLHLWLARHTVCLCAATMCGRGFVLHWEILQICLHICSQVCVYWYAMLRL